jgi:uncharacterized protein (TIGR02271 family)
MMDKSYTDSEMMGDSGNTVVGVYDNYADAERAVDALYNAGFPKPNVQLNPESDSAGSSYSTSSSDTDQHKSGGFFSWLFGEDQSRDEYDSYAEAVRRGHYVLKVEVHSEDEAVRAVDIMEQYNCIDIDERTGHWKQQGWTGYDENAPRYREDEIAQDRSSYLSSRPSGTNNEQRIPVVEEELQVGKRQARRGGVRVFKRVTEKPVQESVQLREEHVNVERHAIDKPLDQADADAFKEGTIELRENSEEAVVGKTARVVEEVVVGKEVRDRTETINDTVRRTDVDVEQLDASSTSGGRSDMMDNDSDFRNHWQTNFGSQGGRYEDYAPAYSYGSTMGNHERYRDAEWNDVEPHLRSDWEANHPESTWDKVKDAVRYGTQRSGSDRRR